MAESGAILRCWARARGYRDRAAEYSTLADNAPGSDVGERYRTVASHYCALADAEEATAERGSRRRATPLRAPAPCSAGPRPWDVDSPRDDEGTTIAPSDEMGAGEAE